MTQINKQTDGQTEAETHISRVLHLLQLLLPLFVRFFCGCFSVNGEGVDAVGHLGG